MNYNKSLLAFFIALYVLQFILITFIWQCKTRKNCKSWYKSSLISHSIYYSKLKPLLCLIFLAITIILLCLTLPTFDEGNIIWSASVFSLFLSYIIKNAWVHFATVALTVILVFVSLYIYIDSFLWLKVTAPIAISIHLFLILYRDFCHRKQKTTDTYKFVNHCSINGYIQYLVFILFSAIIFIYQYQLQKKSLL